IERRRILLALLALGGAMLFHPLVVIPVIVMAWVVLVVRDRRWAWALLAVPAVLALALAGVRPMAALLQFYDAPWWEAVTKANGQVLVLTWPREDWVLLAFDCAVLWVAARAFPSAGLMLRVAAAATVVLAGISALGGDLLHNVLITQLQVWRAHWVSHLLSLALLPAMLLRTWRRDDLRAQTLVLATMAVAVATNARYPNDIYLAGWAAFALWLHVVRGPVEVRVLKIARIATVVALVGTCILVVASTGGQLYAARGNHLSASNIVLLAMTLPALSLPVLLYLLRAQQRGGAPAAAAVAVVLAAIAFGAAHWDQRPPWTRYVEEHLFTEHPFEKLIGPTQQVLWWEQSHAVWALLHRPSYYSGAQGAGLLFNRETALEHRRRASVVGPMSLQRDACDVMAAIGFPNQTGKPCWPTIEAVEEVCRGVRGPDFLVMDRVLDRGLVAKWSAEVSPGNHWTYYLHDCKQIR
ncbi:MAG TPA: hypothetical protein VIL30_27525, partial [Ramlibacter sp.]